jgi:UPF0271 protein
MKFVDLNADLGESFGAWTMGLDDELLTCLSSANISCGWHAGDPAVMERSVRAALAAGVALGAHPGYPDLAGFGRRAMALDAAEIYGAVLYQTGALRAFAEAAGARLSHVKPHGALYNDAAADASKAMAVARAVKASGSGLFLVGPPDSALSAAAAEIGLPYAREFFADRAYGDDGRLVPRALPGAVIHDKDQAVRRTIEALRSGAVASINGKPVTIGFDTICLHGDNPHALAFARGLRVALESAGIALRSFASSR